MNKIKSIITIFFLIFILSGCDSGVFEGELNVNVTNNETNLVPIEIISPLEDNGAIPVNPQDPTNEPFSFFLTRVEDTPSLTIDIIRDDTTITVNSTTRCIPFDAINIYDDKSYFQSLILSTTATTITLNSQIDRNFSITNTIIECAEWDLSTSDGSITPETFSITPPSNRSWHVISTVFNCLDNLAMDSSKFCGGSALINGISGRVIDGYQKDLFLIYNNNGFKLRGFDLDYIDKAPAGVYGLNAELIFKEKYGVVVELNGNTSDTWQAVNRDDLTNQNEIGITVAGHYKKN